MAWGGGETNRASGEGLAPLLPWALTEGVRTRSLSPHPEAQRAPDAHSPASPKARHLGLNAPARGPRCSLRGCRQGGGGRAHPPSTATGRAGSQAGHQRPAGQAGRLHTRSRLVWGILSEGACLRSCGDIQRNPRNLGWASSLWSWGVRRAAGTPSTAERALWPEGRADMRGLRWGWG